MVYTRRVPGWHIGVACTLAAFAGGCSIWGKDENRCVSVEEYQDAESAAEVSIPAGLDRPDPSVKLAIPPGPVPDEPLSKNAACLQWPPDYFDKPLTESSGEN